MDLSVILDEHRHYLSDDVRVSAFRQAIAQVVKPGDIVLDLGAGTGILGLLACQVGARRIYSIEQGEIIELARQLFETNGYQDRVTFIKDLSTRVDLPEKVDVVIADQIGFGPEFGLVEFFRDARDRFMKIGGRLIPMRVDLSVAPIECPEVFAQINFWNDSTTGFNLSPGHSVAINCTYSSSFQPGQLLSEPVMGASLDLKTVSTKPFELKASVRVKRSGRLHGIAGWFSAQLSESFSVSNSPLRSDSIQRKHLYFPIERAITVAEGDWIEIKIRFLPEASVIAWNLEVFDKPPEPTKERGLRKEWFSHSTWNALLLGKEDMQKTRPDFVPCLTARGGARLTALNLCDGQRPLGEIEKEVYMQHPNLFRSLNEAATFVAEIVTRYSS